MTQTAPRPAYFDRFPNFAMTRDADGVLEFRLHTDGGPFKFTQVVHPQFVDAFYEIGRDRDNRVVILTGTGDAWCAEYDRRPEVTPYRDLLIGDRWNHHFFEGRKLMANLLDIEVPVIAAVNGPCLIHSEYVLTADIILAADHAAFQDQPHLSNNNAPTDGMQIFWLLALGPGRGRYFLLTQQMLSAQDAHRYGAVSEVMPLDDLMPRARALAAQLAKQPTLTLRMGRAGLVQTLKRRALDELGLGLAVEGLGMTSKVFKA